MRGVTHKTIKLATCLGLGLLVTACSGQRNYRDVEGLTFVTHQRVGGVTYAVGRDREQDNRFYVNARRANRGKAADMREAVRRAYRCQTTNLAWLSPAQDAAEMTATFCQGR